METSCLSDNQKDQDENGTKTSNVNVNGNGMSDGMDVMSDEAAKSSEDLTVIKAAAGELSNTFHGKINSDGCCTSCNDPHALDSHLKCFWCELEFHAVCRDAVREKMVDRKNEETILSRSFFNSYKQNIVDSQINQKRPHNFMFICNPCGTLLEIEKSSSQQKKVDRLDNYINIKAATY